ncbi:MAG: heparan-alpha-glucosaminide N-acetyltransferase domain-containing protein [Acidobacteriota bacterium]
MAWPAPPAPAPAPPPTPTRRLYIDWLRGVAVLIMIMWHSIDSWTVQETVVRKSAVFSTITFFAGWAAPLFLFLAGVSLPLAGVARMARGLDRRAASAMLQRRGWEVFLIAHLFRLQSFLLNPNGRWNGLLKPDILNILGLAFVYAAFAWGRATTRRELRWWLLAPSIVIVAVLTPLTPTWWWPTLLHPRLAGYIRVVDNNAVFSLFPAAAYLLAGAFFGAMLAEHGENDRAFHKRTAICGAALFAIAGVIALLPWPRPVWFWIGSSAIVSWRIGTMLSLLVISWWWLLRHTVTSTSPLIVFGRTSLFVYWVHVELAYGNFSFPLHHALGLPWAIGAYVSLTLVMLGAARLWLRHAPRGPIVPAYMRGDASPQMSHGRRYPLTP